MSAPFVVRPRTGQPDENAVRGRWDAASRPLTALRGSRDDGPSAGGVGGALLPTSLPTSLAPRTVGSVWTPQRATAADLAEIAVSRPRPRDAGAAASVAPGAGQPTPDRRAPQVAPPPLEPPPVERHPALHPFAAYLDDPDVTDLFVNGAAGLFVDRGSGAVAAREWRATDDEVRDLAVALIGLGGRHIDDASPCVDVRLEGGIRVHAVLPPIAPEGTVISIRVPRLAVATLDDLQRTGMFDAAERRRLDEAISGRANLLVSGAAGAGKTTLLAALLAEASDQERIVTIEDVAELRIAHPHHVRLEARQPNIEGAGGIGLARLVREALRMRPDRLVVGECRGDEVRELLSALNTGHDGGAGTVHANGLHEVPARLEALGALAGMDDRALARQAASAIGLVLHVERGADGARRIAAAGRPILDGDGRLAIEEERWGTA